MRYSGPGLYLLWSAGTTEPGRAGAQPERFVDLVAVDAQGQRAAEVGGVHPLGDFRVGLIAQVELDDHIAAVVARVEIELVAAALLVLQEDRHLAEIDMAFLEVVLAGNGPQVEHLQVLRQRQHDLIDIGQLVAGRVHPDAVGIALQHPGGRVDRRHRLPGVTAPAARG